MDWNLNPDITTATDEQLDWEYNPRLRIPDCNKYFSRWKAEALEARQRLQGKLDIPYGESAAETLDFFPAEGSASSTPMLVFIHGGYWRAMDKADFSWVATPYVSKGVSVALINYALAPSVTIGEIVQQTRRACAWLYRNARSLCVDPQNMACSGHSAGGHLCGMMLATDWPALEPGLPKQLFRSAIAISGLFDLQPLALAPFLRDDIKLDPVAAKQLSPAYLQLTNPADALLAVGELESSEFHRQSELLARRSNPALTIRQLDVAGCEHFSVCDAFARPGVLFEETLGMILR